MCVDVSGPSTWDQLEGKISKQKYYPKLKIVLGRVNMNAAIQVFPLKGCLSQVDCGVFHLVLLPSSNQKIYMTNDNARGKEQLSFQSPDGVYDVVRQKVI